MAKLQLSYTKEHSYSIGVTSLSVMLLNTKLHVTV